MPFLDDFGGMLAEYMLHGAEVITKDGYVMPSPEVKEVNGELGYTGKRKKTQLDTFDVFGTLTAAGAFRIGSDLVQRGTTYIPNPQIRGAEWFRGGPKRKPTALVNLPSSGKDCETCLGTRTICFEDGLASVRFTYKASSLGFGAVADGPSYRSRACVAAYLKLGG